MKNKVGALLILFIMFLAAPVQGQSGSRSLQSLVDAENAFARMAEKNGIREAFLTYLADEAIVFLPKPVPGKKAYEDVPADSPLLLTWTPAFAEVSTGGDLGYTTGPYEARDRSQPGQPARFGHYVSVWERQANRQWKVVFDGGIRHPEPGPRVDAVATRPDGIKLWRGARGDWIQGRKVLVDLEHDFAEAAVGDGLMEAYLLHADKDIRVYRDNALPLVGKDALLKNVSKTSRKLKWDPIDGALSSVGDLGYVYGHAEGIGAVEDSKPEESLSYLRIWRRTSGGQWRIVLDLAVPIPPQK